MPAMSAPVFRERKKSGEKLTMLTAYDFPTAQALDSCGIDAILVGGTASDVEAGRGLVASGHTGQ